MAITHKTRYTSKFYSSNGRRYKLKIYDKNYSGQTIPITIGGGGVKIKYDTKGQEKFSPIMASKCAISLVIEDNVFGVHLQNFIKGLRETYEEGDATVVIWNDSSSTPLWSGNILIDLSTKEDVSKPYEVELNATDGIGLLKNYDMVRVQGSSPYASADTYIPEGYQTFIHWLSIILKYCNTPDSDSTDGNVSDYRISTAVDWWYEEHPTVDPSVSPLFYTECQMLGGYEVTEDALYKVKSVYDVLESICKMWGMKVVFWRNTFYFTQIELYNTADVGTLLNPDNVDSQIWTKDGVGVAGNAYLGNSWFTRFTQDIEPNAGGFKGGLQKLAGSTWDYYPKLKEVIVDFKSISSNNYFQGFPEVSTGGALGSVNSIDNITSTSLGTIAAASGFSGFNVHFVLQYDDGSMTEAVTNWSIRAKPTSDSDFANGYFLRPDISSTHPSGFIWDNYPGIANNIFRNTFYFDSNVSIFVSKFRQALIYDYNVLPMGGSQQTIYSGVIPTDPAFTGDWDFEIFTLGGWINNNGQKWYAHHSRAFDPNVMTWNLKYPNTGNTTPSIDYHDVFDTIGNPVSQFNPVQSSIIGGLGSSTSVLSSRSETQKQAVKDIWWGDTPTGGEPSSLIWTDGAGNFGYTDPNGLWRNGQSGTFNKLIAELLGEARLFNQQQSDYKWSLTTAVSTTNTWSNDGTAGRPIFINPVGMIVDTIDEIFYYLLRGTFNISFDEWEGEWLQVSYDDGISITTTTTTTGGTSPSTGSSARLSGARRGRANPLRITSLREELASGTITSILIDPLVLPANNIDATNIINSGDRFLVRSTTGGYVEEFEASADVGDLATTISVTSKAITSDFEMGSTIIISKRDLYKQYQHKTRGTIAGMDVTTTTIDDTSQLGEYTISYRIEGSGLTSEDPYICNGEDNNKSGRFGTISSGGTSTISPQQALKSARTHIDLPVKIQSGKVAASGTSGDRITIGIYKATPEDDSSEDLVLTKLGEKELSLEGNPKTMIGDIGTISIVTISSGDLIIPIISTDGSSTNFRGLITFTLKYD